MSLVQQVKTKTQNGGTGGTGPSGGSAAARRRTLLRWSNVVAFALLFIAAGLASPHFLNSTNLLNVLRGATMFGIISVGMTIVILNRGIDLSVGSLVGIGAMVGALVAPYGAVTAWIAALAATTFLGLVNGLIITRFNLQPFIATIAMLIFARGILYIYSDGGDIFVRDATAWFTFPGSGYIGPIPTPVIIFVAVWLGFLYVMKHTRWGRHVYAVGANEEAARLYGISVNRIKLQVYALSGFLAGVTGIILVSRVTVCEPNAGELFELDAIAATLIGGTTFDGGIGGVGGTMLGVLILAIISNVLNLIGVSPFAQMLVMGVIIVVAVIFSDLRHRAQ